ncbi:DUF4303 domain-containing protein [Ottowia testudinis]|uniref:DUF4303 domain-containing protein n=1 Tax=Ottowia testudinis TaxID=2816950 RepID=A0A975CDT4_9BURK|nr:DUF4303 domain-containing protein [Ottowia testudinis]QTD44618.1 DUF4303 domain-containing protein [Ottowia testudinis]
MNWFARLLGVRNGAVEPDTADPEEGVKSPWADFDWKSAENGIANLLERDLREFIADNGGEEFYSVAVDCNSLYGDILLSANTTGALLKKAREYSSSASEFEIAREIEEMRWGFGDWEYHGINFAKDEGHAGYKRELPDSDVLEHPDDREMFMECVTRALLRVEASGALDGMRKTVDFKILCKDDEEEFAEAEERMKRLRGADS